jgi:hypothetical protein
MDWDLDNIIVYVSLAPDHFGQVMFIANDEAMRYLYVEGIGVGGRPDIGVGSVGRWAFTSRWRPKCVEVYRA